MSVNDLQDQFYEAFSRGDLDAMMAVWSKEDDIICIHPGGPALVGPAAVQRSWQQVLRAEDLKISASVVKHWIADDIATFVVTEHLYIPSRGIHAETLATNSFRKQDALWKMILHHGSAKPIEAHAAPGAGSQEVH